MSTLTSATAQFSIYKIDIEEAGNAFQIQEDNDAEKYANSIIDSIVSSIKRNPKLSEHYRVSYQGFRGIFFKTIHDPAWYGVAKQMISNNEWTDNQENPNSSFLKNTNISYVLCYIYSDQIYAITGGYGSNYIKKLIEKNYGLYLIPKIIDPDNPVVKAIAQNNLLGNQTSTQKTNKKNTSISLEQDMSSIFRQMSLETDRDTAKNMGIEFDDDESDEKKVSFINKDSFVIRRSLTLHELKAVIHNLYDIEQKDDMFPLNYLVLARKKGISNASLFDALVATLKDEKYDRFVLTGDDYTSFYTGADRYVLYNEKNEVLIDTQAPITFSNVISVLDNPKLTKCAFRTMLKNWTLSTFDHGGGPIIQHASIFDSIQGFVESGNNQQVCYLFNGAWYVFDEKFGDLLRRAFEHLFDNQEHAVNTLANTFGLRIHATTEDEYNSSLYNLPNVIVAHTVLLDYVEIADGIFWDDHSVYFMHNKTKFSGSGARDVTNQVLTSAEYLQQRLVRHDRIAFIENYYDKIFQKYQNKGNTLSITKDDFVNALNSGKTFHYVTGYINEYNRYGNSTYAKYLTVETEKRLASKGYKYSVMSTSP